MDAWKQAAHACDGIERERIGLIVTSGFGPHCRGFRFLDGLLDCGDSAASPQISPTRFMARRRRTSANFWNCAGHRSAPRILKRGSKKQFFLRSAGWPNKRVTACLSVRSRNSVT